jgi:hypothetical protein
MESNPRDSPETVELELDHEEIDFLEENFPKIEINGVTYYLVSM